MEDERTPLSLVRVTDAGRALLLRDEQGDEFTLAITPELRTIVSTSAPSTSSHGGTPRRSETKMTSSLRPRDIQNRIRSGESPESVAEAAGTSVEAIMPYVAPVLAEREHVASTAQRASLRRGPGDPPTTPPLNRTLGAAVTAHLESLEAKADDIEWDAYRRETGRWVLTAGFETPERSGTARFTYDAPGNYALTDNDDARWLIGDLVAPEPAVEPVDDLQQIRQRRQAAVSGADVPLGGSLGDPLAHPLGEDSLDLVSDPTSRTTRPTASSGRSAADELPFDEPLRPTAPARSEAAENEREESAEEAESRLRRHAPKKRGRASVPSWDEIMFGPSGD